MNEAPENPEDVMMAAMAVVGMVIIFGLGFYVGRFFPY